MKLPPPRATLAGCIWLPRILQKARLLESGALPTEYVERFCSAMGVDNQFLGFFGLAKEDILAAARLNDERAAEWFTYRATKERITEWNHVAVNLGRAGFPMAERLPIALATTYQHLDAASITSVFEALEADESL